MDAAKKYLSDYFKYRLSTILGGRKNYEEWRARNYSLRKVRITNSKLATELEKASKKRGFLTYSEFLTIDQFGTNGYHTRHRDHGITETHKHWGRAVASYCKANDINDVLEFGPGAGDLGIEIMKAARKKGVEISWSGIELNPDLRKRIKTQFIKYGFRDKLKEVVAVPSELKNKKPGLVVFSYSLDSISPEIFINTTKQKNYPDALIGVKIEDGILEETLLNDSLLEKIGFKLKNGIYSQKQGPSFNLSAWKLHPSQRAYVSIPSFNVLIEFVSKFPNSTYLVIDEFQPPSYSWETRHLLVPKDLHRFKREVEDLDKGYRDAGENLLYFQMYFFTFYRLLNSLGFKSIQYEIEQKMARDLSGEKFFSVKEFLTFAFLAKDKIRSPLNIIPLEFPKAVML